MAAVTIHSDFGAQEYNFYHYFYVFPSIFRDLMGPDAMILLFWILSFKPAFSFSSFTFIKRLFSSFSLSAVRVVSPAYLSLLTFPQAILIPGCASPSHALCVLYCAYQWNKQDNNMQAWCTLFPIYNQSVVPCPVLIIVSWPAYRFIRSLVRWSGISISLRIFHSFCDSQKDSSIINEAEIDVFLAFSWFFYDPMDVVNLNFGSSAFPKSSLNN